MSKFIIDESFWELFPEGKLGILIAKNISNTYEDEEVYHALLKDAQEEAFKFLRADTLSENEVIKVWRQAFLKFKTKKGARSSIEALLKRVSKGKGLSPINPLVDIYNASSLIYGLPHGGEDMDQFAGDVKLTLADGHEDFLTLGSEKNEPPYEGELVYKDEAGAICRCFNWREAVRTMLREDTSNAFLCIESLDSEREDDLKEALAFLENKVSHLLGGQCKTYILDINHSSIEL